MASFTWLTELGDRRLAGAILFGATGIIGGLLIALATAWIAVVTLVGPIDVEPADSALEILRAAGELLPALFIAAVALPLGFLLGAIAVPVLVALTLRWDRLGQTVAHLLTMELIAIAITVLSIAWFDVFIEGWHIAALVAVLGGAIPAVARWRVSRAPES